METFFSEFHSDISQMPVTLEDYPHLTVSMIVDELTRLGAQILHEASKPRRTFRWYKRALRPTDDTLSESVSSDSFIEEGESEGTDASDGEGKKRLFGVKEILYICTARTAPLLFKRHKHAYALVIVKPDTDLTPLASYMSRCLIVSASENASPDIIDQGVKSLFTRMLIWECALESITLKDGELTDMLEVSKPIIGNYIFASDLDGNVIACMPGMEPPDDLHRHIISSKTLDAQVMKTLRPKAPQGELCTFQPSGPSLYTQISYPVYVECSYTGSLSMTCNNRVDTKGLRDQFKILCDCCMPFFRRIWVNQVTASTPSIFFFNRLLTNDIPDETYLETQKESLGLSTMNRFKLVLLDIDVNFDVARSKRVSATASKLNNKKVHIFPYQGKLLMLMYGSISDDLLAHATVMRVITQTIYEPFGVPGCISSVFYNITDLDLAYQQTLVAYQYRPAIMRARFADDEFNTEALVTFEAALMYYLIDNHSHDERFLEFAFSSSVISTLYNEDLESGTNHLSILWCYLYNERNATAVADHLHMHRNTVLYNIQKIEQRFGLSLDDKTVRDWMLLCFRYLIVNTDSRIFDNSFVIDEPINSDKPIISQHPKRTARAMQAKSAHGRSQDAEEPKPPKRRKTRKREGAQA